MEKANTFEPKTSAYPPSAMFQRADPSKERHISPVRYIEHKPDCPAGGAYSLNAVREKCTCSVATHEN